MTVSTKPKLLTFQAAAAEFGIPATSLRDLVIRGVLPSVRIASSRRIWLKREDIETLIARSTERAS
jgi:hypothetical protein